MAHNTLIFVRHGETQVEQDKPISEWELSDAGHVQAERIAQTPELKDIDIIITSNETKAYQTAWPLAQKLGKPIIQYAELAELNRDDGGYMDKPTYEETAQQALARPTESIGGWEPADVAFNRVVTKIKDIDNEFSGKRILIVGHGYTLNMYFAELLGEKGRAWGRLKSKENNFGDWGVIEDGKVVKDLGKPFFEKPGEKPSENKLGEQLA